MPVVRMLGTRGVPAEHGGFETAAESIGLELVRRGWRVIVYCQTSEARVEDTWQGIERVSFPGRFEGAKGTIWFDAQVVRHAARHRDLCLTFGYNTAFLNLALRAKGITNVINMDGMEWQRARWSRGQRAFLYANERAGCVLGNHLIADHPEIARHLLTRAHQAKITTIPYGSPTVTQTPTEPLAAFGVEAGHYCTLIARPVEENSILEVVRTWSNRPRGVKLVVLGTYTETDPYHRAVVAAAGQEVVFAGAIYDQRVVQALRLHSRAYVHGHTVGGTNPSLVEALGCGNPVIAHDNPYNRWVAGAAARYFSTPRELEVAIDEVCQSLGTMADLSRHARDRHAEAFTWPLITDQYEDLLRSHL